MMNYEIFKKVVEEKFESFLPEKYKGMEVVVQPVEKINRTLDAITIVNPNNKRNISSVVYINDMYNDYTDGLSVDEVIQKTINTIDGVNIPEVLENINYQDAQDKIIFQLINSSQNKNLLKNVPNRPFNDLSIIYRMVIEINDKGILSTIIKNDFAEQLKMDETQLFKVAVENTRKLLSPVVKPMNDLLSEMGCNEGNDMPNNALMYVISNEKGINGASAILYEDVLYELSTKINSDLYLMPSSVHEFIAVPTWIGSPLFLAEVVNEINMTNVLEEERLSNQVYRYSKDLRKISMATNTQCEIVKE